MCRAIKKVVCKTRYCKNVANQGSYCKTCVSRTYRSRNPVRASYNALKANAKRRGKIFRITFSDFQKFCRRSDYMAGKGRTKESYTIDCIDPRLGYVEGNMQVLPNSENARKGNRVLMYDWQSGYATVISRTG